MHSHYAVWSFPGHQSSPMSSVFPEVISLFLEVNPVSQEYGGFESRVEECNRSLLGVMWYIRSTVIIHPGTKNTIILFSIKTGKEMQPLIDVDRHRATTRYPTSKTTHIIIVWNARGLRGCLTTNGCFKHLAQKLCSQEQELRQMFKNGPFRLIYSI